MPLWVFFCTGGLCRMEFLSAGLHVYTRVLIPPLKQAAVTRLGYPGPSSTGCSTQAGMMILVQVVVLFVPTRMEA